jgi:hypothetical protein
VAKSLNLVCVNNSYLKVAYPCGVGYDCSFNQSLDSVIPGTQKVSVCVLY